MKAPLYNLNAITEVKVSCNIAVSLKVFTLPLQDILLRCWCYSSSNRPSFGDILTTLNALPRKRLDRSPPFPGIRSYESIFWQLYPTISYASRQISYLWGVTSFRLISSLHLRYCFLYLFANSPPGCSSPFLRCFFSRGNTADHIRVSRAYIPVFIELFWWASYFHWVVSPYYFSFSMVLCFRIFCVSLSHPVLHVEIIVPFHFVAVFIRLAVIEQHLLRQLFFVNRRCVVSFPVLQVFRVHARSSLY